MVNVLAIRCPCACQQFGVEIVNPAHEWRVGLAHGLSGAGMAETACTERDERADGRSWEPSNSTRSKPRWPMARANDEIAFSDRSSAAWAGNMTTTDVRRVVLPSRARQCRLLGQGTWHLAENPNYRERRRSRRCASVSTWG